MTGSHFFIFAAAVVIFVPAQLTFCSQSPTEEECIENPLLFEECHKLGILQDPSELEEDWESPEDKRSESDEIVQLDYQDEPNIELDKKSEGSPWFGRQSRLYEQLRLGKRSEIEEEKRSSGQRRSSMDRLRLGKRLRGFDRERKALLDSMRIGKRARMDSLRLGKRAPLDSLRLGKRAPMDSLRLGKRAPMDSLRLGKRAPMDSLRLGKRAPLDSLRLGKRGPLAEIMRLGRRSPLQTTLRLGK